MIEKLLLEDGKEEKDKSPNFRINRFVKIGADGSTRDLSKKSRSRSVLREEKKGEEEDFIEDGENPFDNMDNNNKSRSNLFFKGKE